MRDGRPIRWALALALVAYNGGLGAGPIVHCDFDEQELTFSIRDVPSPPTTVGIDFGEPQSVLLTLEPEIWKSYKYIWADRNQHTVFIRRDPGMGVTNSNSNEDEEEEEDDDEDEEKEGRGESDDYYDSEEEENFPFASHPDNSGSWRLSTHSDELDKILGEDNVEWIEYHDGVEFAKFTEILFHESHPRTALLYDKSRSIWVGLDEENSYWSRESVLWLRVQEKKGFDATTLKNHLGYGRFI